MKFIIFDRSRHLFSLRSLTWVRGSGYQSSGRWISIFLLRAEYAQLKCRTVFVISLEKFMAWMFIFICVRVSVCVFLPFWESCFNRAAYFELTKVINFSPLPPPVAPTLCILTGEGEFFIRDYDTVRDGYTCYVHFALIPNDVRIWTCASSLQ